LKKTAKSCRWLRALLHGSATGGAGTSPDTLWCLLLVPACWCLLLVPSAGACCWCLLVELAHNYRRSCATWQLGGLQHQKRPSHVQQALGVAFRAGVLAQNGKDWPE